MNDDPVNDDRLRDLERRSRAAFDARVAATDGDTRARLARARHAALAAGERTPLARPAVWMPAAAAAAAVAALLLAQRDEGRGGAAQPVIASEDIDLVTGGEDFGLLAEDADFVAWAAGEIADDVG